MNQEKSQGKRSQHGQDALKKIMSPESPASPPAIPPIPPMATGPISPPPPPSPPAPEGKPEERPKRKNPSLDHWSVSLAEADPNHPGDFLYRLRGEIHGHPNPRFSDGQIVDSSPLVLLDVTQRVARTKNTVYELGEPDPTFVDFIEKIGKKLEDYNYVFEENARKNPRRL